MFIISNIIIDKRAINKNIPKLLRLTLIFFLLIAFIIVSAISYASAISENISNSNFV